MFRSPILLDLAKGAPCMIRIDGVCNGNSETVVAAHSNWQEHGKGVGLKAHDCFVAFACSACHDAVDGRSHRIPKLDRQHYWQRGFERTVLYLFEQGKLKVKS